MVAQLCLLWMITYIVSLTSAPADLNWFGFRVSSNPAAETSGMVTITLWYNTNIYQCLVWPSSKQTYVCTSNTWLFLGSSECYPPEYKMRISNQLTDDAVAIDSFILQDKNSTWWSSDSWCIPDSEASNGYWNSQGHWKIDDNACPAQHSNWNTMCIDNEAKNLNYGCWPQSQMIYFNTSEKNKTSYAVAWENGEVVSIDPKTCAPTLDPTTMPTQYPTGLTLSPSQSPTTMPTQYTGSPTSVTISPSQTPQTPSVSPTHVLECEENSNVIWKVSFDFILKQNSMSTETVISNLENAAVVFINSNINKSSICNVLSYNISIGLVINLERAYINASICFDCPNGTIFTINIDQTELEIDFTETVSKDNTILSVNAIHSFTVDVLNPHIVTTMDILSTMETTESSDNKSKNKTWIGSMDFMEGLMLLIVLIVFVMLTISLWVCIIRKKKIEIQIINSKRLVEMQATSDGNTTLGHSNVNNEKCDPIDQDTENEDLYSSNSMNIAVMTPTDEETQNNTVDNDSDLDDMYENEQNMQITSDATQTSGQKGSV